MEPRISIILPVFNGAGFIAALAADFRPDRIQLNTAVRPPAEKGCVHRPPT